MTGPLVDPVTVRTMQPDELERRLFVGGPLDGQVIACPAVRIIAPEPLEPVAMLYVDTVDGYARGDQELYPTVTYERRWFGVSGCTFPVMVVDGRAPLPSDVYAAVAKSLELPTRGYDT